MDGADNVVIGVADVIVLDDAISVFGILPVAPPWMLPLLMLISALMVAS